MPPDVSVVIPLRTGEAFLDAAIASARTQVGVAVEIVVVDDRPTRAAGVAATSWGPDIRVFGGHGRGPGAARNVALGQARGRHVAFLDADDVFRPGKLAAQAALLDGDMRVDVVATAWAFIDAAGRQLPQGGRCGSTGNVWANLLCGNLVPPVAVMVRRRALDLVRGFDESLGVNEDWDLFLRLARAGARWAAIDRPLCAYRVHADQWHRRPREVARARDALVRRAFADPALPVGHRALETRARQQAFLLSASEHVEAGMHEAGRALFLEAVRARPDWAIEPRAIRGFCRLLRPLGWQCRADVVAHWPEVRALLLPWLDAAAALPEVIARTTTRELRRARNRALWPIVRGRALAPLRSRLAAIRPSGQTRPRG